MDALFPDRGASREATALEVRGLTRTPGVYDASFTLREGEIRAPPGPSAGVAPNCSASSMAWILPSR